MPTYEYACAACGHEWEQLQRITEPPIDLCPKCAKSTAHRLISGGTNFILKGGGWYSDLYASPKAASKKGDDTAASSSSEGASSKASSEKGAKTDATSSTSTSAGSNASSPAPSSSAS